MQLCLRRRQNAARAFASPHLINQATPWFEPFHACPGSFCLCMGYLPHSQDGCLVGRGCCLLDHGRRPSTCVPAILSGFCCHEDPLRPSLTGFCSQLREKFPERVPFRLTRMMVQAMEVSGIEGNFRCAHTRHNTRYQDCLTERTAAPQRHVCSGGCLCGLKQDRTLDCGLSSGGAPAMRFAGAGRGAQRP